MAKFFRIIVNHNHKCSFLLSTFLYICLILLKNLLNVSQHKIVLIVLNFIIKKNLFMGVYHHEQRHQTYLINNA